MNRMNYIIAAMYGVLGIFIIALIVSVVFSLLLKFTSYEQISLHIAITIVSFITVFVGGVIAGKKGKENGWLLGALTGVLYTLIIFLFQFLGFDHLFSAGQMIFHVGYVIVAVCGGIVGVNTLKSAT